MRHDKKTNKAFQVIRRAGFLTMLLLYLTVSAAVIRAQAGTTINGISLPYPDNYTSTYGKISNKYIAGDGVGSGCYRFAYLVYGDIFNRSLATDRWDSSCWVTPYKQILPTTADNLKKYILQSGPGAVIRVTSYSYYYEYDDNGHSMVIVDADDNGVWIYQAGGDGLILSNNTIKYWTWTTMAQKCVDGGFSEHGQYIKYIVCPPEKRGFNSAPIVSLDIANASPGKLWVRGWAFDPDVKSQALAVHIYISKDSTDRTFVGAVSANTPREDVNTIYECGSNHGFDETIYTKDLEGTYSVWAAAIDANGGPANWVEKKNVQFEKDTTNPTITDISIESISDSKFRVKVTATDNVAVSQVVVPVWRSSLGGNSATWYDAVRADSTTWYYDVERGKEEQTYYADVYIGDYQGNGTKAQGTIRHSNIIVSYSADGGTCNSPSKEIAAVWYDNKPYQTYGELPTPTRDGFSFQGWFTEATGGEEITSDSNVTIMGDHTLYAHWKQERVMQSPDFTLPTSLKTISPYAFAGGAMTVVKCPEGLEEIGEYAFSNCGSLKEIYIPASVVSIENDVFRGCPSDLTIFGPENGVGQAYAKLNGINFVTTGN